MSGAFGQSDPSPALAVEAAPAVSTAARRIVAAVVAAGSAVVIGIAAWLTPAAEGQGTHEQLGLPACSWINLYEVPCPTCGMTTAFSHAADGNLLASVQAQPLGFLLAIATACALIVGLYVSVTGSAVASMLSRLWCKRTIWGIIVLIIGSWIYKILSMRGLL